MIEARELTKRYGDTTAVHFLGRHVGGRHAGHRILIGRHGPRGAGALMPGLTGSWIPTSLPKRFSMTEGTPVSASSRWHQPHTRRWAFAELIALSSLVLGAVGSGVASASTGTTETVGFDFSYTKPDAGAMADARYDFAIGYVSHNPAKNLTAGQVAAYRDAGIHVGLVWETTEGRALEGGSAGAEDGRAAENQADILDYPDDAVIFFAVDTNTTTADYPAIKAYAEAFNQATRRPVGIFGEADVLDHFVKGGRSTVQYGWQTAAWSHGRVSEKADLYKRVGHPSRPVPDGISPRSFDEVVAIRPVPLAR